MSVKLTHLENRRKPPFTMVANVKTTALPSKELAVTGANIRGLRMDELHVYSASGRAYPRRRPRDRSELSAHRLPFVRRCLVRGKPYMYFTKSHEGPVLIPLPDIADIGFGHAYLEQLAALEGSTIEPYAPPVRSVVYFVQPDSSGPIKIGFARNMAKRLVNLQSGNHERLVVRATTLGTQADERAYHARFAEYRLHGEWFSPHPEILAEIERLANPPPPR